MAADLGNPIINSPYDPPESHFEIGPAGPTGVLLPGRRPSEPPINDIRREVERWRASNWNGVTPYTRRLLAHWAAGPAVRDEPVFFCQREAAETAIFVAEVAGRHGTADHRRRLESENRLHNDGLPRVGLKMATGTGKTVVMAMIIAWQTVNKVMTPHDARFAKRFLVLAPGVTIRDRLGVLRPQAEDNYYAERDLLPPDLWEPLLQARVEIVSYHAFLPRDAAAIRGVAANTRRLLRAGTPEEPDAFRETPDMVAARVMRAFGTGKGDVVVLNDEAHHCYQDTQDRDGNGDARVWFRGLRDLRRRAGIKAVYDLSATPYYLQGSGQAEGSIFPWVVSDFSLMDAIESGIVKIPRLPVDDAGCELIYLQLWDHIRPPLPRRRAPDARLSAHGWTMPEVLEGALRSLYRSYERDYRRYEAGLAALGEPPPVLIVVCPNTVVSRLVFDWIAGRNDGTKLPVPGNLPLLSNVADGSWADLPRTVLIDSEQLESGELPGAEREIINTIGKPGKPGEHIRCVVSVAMLTEGWDANTVTHILGVRPFRSQLLCEQVVGRGLRRRDYAVDPGTGRPEPEYVEVYGVPFAFIPGDRQIPRARGSRRPTVEIRALPDRRDLAIRFPKLDGYRIELPGETLRADFGQTARMHLSRATVAEWAKSQADLQDIAQARTQRIAFAIARTLIGRERFFAARGGAQRPWLFPQLARIARQWLDECVTAEPGVARGHLLLTQACDLAAEKVFSSIVCQAPEPVLLPVIRRFDPSGCTDDVHFVTRKAVMDPPPVKSHLNHVVLGSPREEALADALEKDPRVVSYAKNERLGLAIPYLHEGQTHEYVPDFLARLVTGPRDVDRTLIIEVCGSLRSPGPAAAKADAARHQWCAAVNNWGEFGRWGYLEAPEPAATRPLLSQAIDTLYAGLPA